MQKYVVDYAKDFAGNTHRLNGNSEIGIITINPEPPVEPNTPFTVTYTAINNVENQAMWGHIRNQDTGQVFPSWSRWETNVPQGSTYTSVVQFDGISQTFNGIIEIGHVIEAAGFPIWVLLPIGILCIAGVAYYGRRS